MFYYILNTAYNKRSYGPVGTYIFTIFLNFSSFFYRLNSIIMMSVFVFILYMRSYAQKIAQQLPVF